MKKCVFCGKNNPFLICLQCQDEKITDETRNNSSLRNKFFRVCCPVCKRDRVLGYCGIRAGFYARANKEINYPNFICKSCSNKIRTEKCSQKKPPATAEINGCIIQEAKRGRCEEDCPDEKYLVCLDKVIELDWPGFKKIG